MRGRLAALLVTTTLLGAACDAVFNIGEPLTAGGADASPDQAAPLQDARIDSSSRRRDGSPGTGSSGHSSDAAADGSGPGSGSSSVSNSASGSASTSSSGTGDGGGPHDGGIDGGACTAGARQCSGGGVQTCGATGHWGQASSCATGMCAGGNCTGSTATAPSCATTGAGLSNCGTTPESCCESVEVPGGTYDRTYTNTGAGPDAGADPATVSGLRLDKYLVTVGRFRQFVGAWNGGSGFLPIDKSGKHTHLNGGQGLANSGSPGAFELGWQTSNDSSVDPTTTNLTSPVCGFNYPTWTASAGALENLPITCVNWWEAYAFCIWDGGFLPSEAEWEYAAAGGSQELEYPWGSSAPGTSSEYAIYNCDYPTVGGACSSVASIAPVGSAAQGIGLFGQLDMAGDASEWTLDFYISPYVDPCIDCSGQTATATRAVRGGLYSSPAAHLYPSWRNSNGPAARNGGIGFRCARVP
jgi:sulfatase modifying factor 1